MSISYRVLGTPGRDNALFVTITGGQRTARLLFDCGAACLADLSVAEILATEHLFFSHLHMDHIGGFDDFFRLTFRRSTPTNHLWGPPETNRILQHRFQGFLWNLHTALTGTWQVHDIYPTTIETGRYELAEAFAVCHSEDTLPYHQVVWADPAYRVSAVTLDHRTPSLAYIVREPTRQNIDTQRLEALGLMPGPWLSALKNTTDPAESIEIAGRTYDRAQLRQEVIVETPGASLAYLTDARLNDAAIELLLPALQDCQILVCEAQYQHADSALAEQHYHMTSVQAATLAKRAGVQQLILFHLSDRYPMPVWQRMLEDAQHIFPQTSYPEHWQIDS